MDIAKGPHAKEIMEYHWDTWIVDDDWRFLDERGINSVRIPVSSFGLVPKIVIYLGTVRLDIIILLLYSPTYFKVPIFKDWNMSLLVLGRGS